MLLLCLRSLAECGNCLSSLDRTYVLAVTLHVAYHSQSLECWLTAMPSQRCIGQPSLMQDIDAGLE